MLLESLPAASPDSKHARVSVRDTSVLGLVLMSTTRKGTPAPSDQISHEGATKRAARSQAFASVKTIGGVTCKDGTVLTATDVQNVIFDHGHGNFFPTQVMKAVNDHRQGRGNPRYAGYFSE